MKEWFTDLELPYEIAMHGIQTDIGFNQERSQEPKHLRVGVDSAIVTQYALASLLVEKGIFTLDEYKERVRLAANDELYKREVEAGMTMR